MTLDADPAGGHTAEPSPGKDAFVFGIDFPYQMVTRQRPKGWRLVWLRLRWAPHDLLCWIRDRLQPGWDE